MTRPHFDLDAVILMATTLSSKRRPAELAEIVAAADMIQGFTPYPEKLGAAIERLSRAGLIDMSEGGYTLTAVAREIMAQQPKKGEMEGLVAALKDQLALHRPKEESPAFTPSDEELGAAVRAHKATSKAAGKNLLMPKPKTVRHFKVEGRWRRTAPTR